MTFSLGDLLLVIFMEFVGKVCGKQDCGEIDCEGIMYISVMVL